MKKIKIYFSFFALIIYSSLFAQVEKSELIFFNDQKFTKLIENIIESKKNCGAISKNHNWYIEEIDDGTLIVSLSRIGNLLQDIGDRKIYSTVVNNTMVFYITQNKTKNFSRTGFFVDLSNYKNYEYVLFEDFSSWVIVQKGDSFHVKNKQIWDCD